MIALIAALLAAPPLPVTQRGAWLEMQAGPQVLFRDRRASVGPEIRLDLGVGFSERIAAEAWLSGAFDPAPTPSPDDRSRIGAGIAARARLFQLDSEGKLMLWGRAGVGYAFATPNGSGPVAFAGPQLLFQPFVKRFALGLELDGVANRSGLGFALLPSLRCAL
ncbi:MAG TPA: hypothetical protein VE620_15145 [Myxococcales bacterium]|jgi:hypothetical protein|nr:hypothetical protein [Myxococcales bacterium]